MPPRVKAQVCLAGSSAEKLPPFASGVHSLMEETVGMRALWLQESRVILWGELGAGITSPYPPPPTPRLLLKDVDVPLLSSSQILHLPRLPHPAGCLWVGVGPD